ncbi:MAG: GGDEF domain-containing protein [Lysobacterales bacterium CG_4_10_14_3_um_filter_64_11]|nr:MAG: GGDEF domain-containing protein [Xanthomonadales bacterium CG_4_10_14_3_um_filter_64_11]
MFGRLRVSRNVLLAALVLLSFAGTVLAIDSKALATYSREVWTTRDGLPHNQVNGIAQTPEGYLWFATWEGLVRYNGQEFRTFGGREIPELRDNGIRSVAVGASGNLLVATSRGGVGVRRQGVWQGYTVADGLAQNESMAVAEDRAGNVWVAHESEGVSRIGSDGRIRVFDVSPSADAGITYAVFVDHTDVVWVGTGEGLVRIEGERVLHFDQTHGLPTGAVFAIVQSRDGLLYVGTEHGVFQGMGGRFQAISVRMPDEAVASLQVADAGDVWIGTVNRGLLRFSASRGLEQIDTAMGLPNNRVPSLFIDSEENVWVGTNAGLVRLADTPFVSYDQQLGLSNDYVRALLQTRSGDILIGSSGGVDRWRNEVISAIGADAGLGGDAILSLAEDRDGSLWIGMYSKGLIHWKDERIVSQQTMLGELPASQVRALLVARDGSLWVGVARGLAHIKDGTTTVFTREQGLPRNFVVSLYQARDGRIWVGTADGVAWIKDDVVTAIDLSAMHGAQDVFGMHEDADGTMWFATDRGLVRLRDGQLAVLGKPEGLPVITVFQVITDAYDNFWLTSNSGVIQLRRNDVEAVMAGHMETLPSRQFSEADGMGSAQCNGGSGPAALLARDGSLWVATAKGAAVIQPDKLAKYQFAPPPVVIEGVRVDGQPVAAGAAIVASPGVRKIEFDYVSLSFRTPEQIRYRYRLKGFDRDWVERARQRSAQYTNLPPGKYQFQVAAGRAGQWSDALAIQAFELEPRLYQRGWFVPLLVLLLAMALYVGFRLRVRAMEVRELELAEQVAQRTLALSEKNNELKALNRQILAHSDAFARQARSDALTGIGNRRDMEERLASAFHESLTQGKPLCLALLDIDNFKRINDRYSHQAGDSALKAIATALKNELAACNARSGHTCCAARWGGEEFALLFLGVELDAGRNMAERVRVAIESIDCRGFAPGLIITGSIGIADSTGCQNHERMVSHADKQLYQAKAAGRNRVMG